MSLSLESYHYQSIKYWPGEGQHIQANYDDEHIIVYQAYQTSIAQYILENNTFIGCPDFSMKRMTWIKPNFMWMMYRSAWGTSERQENIIGIVLKKTAFNELLQAGYDQISIQYNRDHNPFGFNIERRAIQIGIRDKALNKIFLPNIVRIIDMNQIVEDGRKIVFGEKEVKMKNVENMFVSEDFNDLMIPIERIYYPKENI